MNDLGLWELHPLFSAAEDVQHSADRLESAYRGWMHSTRTSHGTEQSRKELITAFETTKWQLEEFERAFTKANPKDHRTGRALERYRSFIEAISHQISLVESDLRNSANEDAHGLYTISIDDGDRDELASFLLGSQMTEKNDTNAYTFSSEKYEIEETPTSYLDETKRSDSVRCEYPVALNMDVQDGLQASREEELYQNAMLGSRLLGFQGKENVTVSSQELEKSFIHERMFCPGDQSVLDKNAKKTNAGYRNEGIQNGFVDWKDGIDAISDKGKDHMKHKNRYQSWNSWFHSISRHLGGKLQHSKSGLKRYKDGELDSMANCPEDTSIGCVQNVSASYLEKGENSNISTSGRWWNGFPFMFHKVKPTALFRNKSEQKLLHSRALQFHRFPSKCFLVLLVIAAISVYCWILSKSMLLISGDVQGN